MAPDVPVRSMRPPNSSLPYPPRSTDARADAACRDAYAKLAANRRKTALIDWRIGRPENREPDNYFDHTHDR